MYVCATGTGVHTYMYVYWCMYNVTGGCTVCATGTGVHTYMCMFTGAGVYVYATGGCMYVLLVQEYTCTCTSMFTGAGVQGCMCMLLVQEYTRMFTGAVLYDMYMYMLLEGVYATGTGVQGCMCTGMLLVQECRGVCICYWYRSAGVYVYATGTGTHVCLLVQCCMI